MSSGALGLSLAVWFLALGAQGRRLVAQSVRECHRGADWGVGSGLAGLHLKNSLTGDLFTTISRNWLTLGGPVPPASA